jgi:hypothetical protein
MEDFNDRAHSSPRSHIQFSSARSNRLRVSNLKHSGGRFNQGEEDRLYGAVDLFD